MSRRNGKKAFCKRVWNTFTCCSISGSLSKSIPVALAISKGIGGTRAGAIITNFKEEVETDWFGEQVDLCGGVQSMIVNAFDMLVEAGCQPEIAYFECLHELKLMVDLIFYKGLTGINNGVSEIAKYGGFTRGDKIIDENSKNNIKKVLQEIQSGIFAKELNNIYAKDKKTIIFQLYAKNRKSPN